MENEYLQRRQALAFLEKRLADQTAPEFSTATSESSLWPEKTGSVTASPDTSRRATISSRAECIPTYVPAQSPAAAVSRDEHPSTFASPYLTPTDPPMVNPPEGLHDPASPSKKVIAVKRGLDGKLGIKFVHVGSQRKSQPHKIEKLAPGGAAAESRCLFPGDMVHAIEGKSIEDLDTDQLLRALRGAPCATVRFTVSRKAADTPPATRHCAPVYLRDGGQASKAVCPLGVTMPVTATAATVLGSGQEAATPSPHMQNTSSGLSASGPSAGISLNSEAVDTTTHLLLLPTSPMASPSAAREAAPDPALQAPKIEPAQSARATVPSYPLTDASVTQSSPASPATQKRLAMIQASEEVEQKSQGAHEEPAAANACRVRRSLGRAMGFKNRAGVVVKRVTAYLPMRPSSPARLARDLRPPCDAHRGPADARSRSDWRGYGSISNLFTAAEASLRMNGWEGV